MLSPSPKTPLREKGDQRPNLAIEVDSPITSNDVTQNLRGRLDEGWRAAVIKFKEITGKDLGDYRGGKDGVLGTLRARYSEENKNAKKKDDLWAIVEKVLSCVEFLGSIAAQVGSMVFQPANLCFSAIQTLISIPQAFKKLRDDLHSLFNQIAGFLINFRVLQRVDTRLGLDTALVEKTNEILLTMVDICALSDAVAHHKILAVAGSIFLKNDKVQAALERFRSLIEEQNKLTSTITLEAALQTRATTQTMSRHVTMIGEDVRGISRKVDDIQAFQTDDKNVKVNQSKINEIDDKFKLTQADVREPHDSLEQCQNDMVKNTIGVFAKSELYNDWSRSKARHKFLFLKGEKGSGRTHLLAALTREIFLKRDKLTKDDHKLYVAYYAFRREDSMLGGKSWTPLQHALKVMASQIARQSETYTKTLHKNLDTINDAHTLEEYWRSLKLDNFEAPDDSTLYLFFDGLEQLKGSLFKDLKAALDPKNSTVNWSSKTRQRLRLRIIVTGNEETIDVAGLKPPTIDVRRLNEPLLRGFVKQKVDTILSHGLVLQQSNGLIEDVLQDDTGTFTSVLQRIDMIKKAVSMDMNLEELREKLRSNKGSNSLLLGAQILDKVCSQLSSEHQQQLKEILYWAVAGYMFMTVEMLEAALFLRRPLVSLEPLESKITNRFVPAVTIRAGKIIANSDVEEYMRNTDSASTDSERPSRITLEMKIENVDETIIKNFVWDLNNAMVTGRFDFGVGMEAGKQPTKGRLHFSRLEAHYTIATHCLQVLQTLDDDRTRDKTASLLSYACQNLPKHIHSLDTPEYYESLSAAQLRSLGQSIVSFLTDPECIDLVWLYSPVAIPPSAWLYDHANVRSIGNFLTHPLVTMQLDPRDRRAAERLTKQTPENPAPFLESLAAAAASQWLDRKWATRDHEQVCFHSVDAYLRLPEATLSELKFQHGEDTSSLMTSLEKATNGEATNKDAVDETANGNEEKEVDSIPVDDETIGEDDGAAVGEIDVEFANRKVTRATMVPALLQKLNKDTNFSTDETCNDDDSVLPEHKIPVRSNTITDQVKQALNWSLKRLGLEADFFVFYRLGRTLVDHDSAAAIVYLKQAFDNAPKDDLSARLRTAYALAEAHARNDTAEAYSALVPVLEEFRSLRNKRTFSEDEKKLLFKALAKAADYLMDKDDDTGAIIELENALSCSPNDGECHRKLIRLLCKTEQLTRAQERFDRWTYSSANNRGYGPQAHFIEIARRDRGFTLCSFFHYARQSPLHTSIVQALTAAIEYEGTGLEYLDKRALHFARGLALAITKEDEGLQAAKEEWEACIHSDGSMNFAHDPLIRKSWIHAAQYYFDQFRKQLSDHPHMSTTQKRDLFRQLYDIVEQLQQDSAGLWIVFTPWTYVASFAKLVGLDKDAKDLLRSDMKSALEVLRDDDPENDGYGLARLIRVLRCYGDVPGQCTVWSIFDRDTLAEKRENRWATQSTVIHPGINNTITTQSPDLSSRVVVIPPSKASIAKIPGIMNAHLECYCDGCHAYLNSLSGQEIWSCTFCPERDFCRSCYTKLKNKQLENVMCSHDHVHRLGQHLDYDREEVQGQNVKIDWRIVEKDGGRTRHREGGRVVQFQDWLDMLEREWDLKDTI